MSERGYRTKRKYAQRESGDCPRVLMWFRADLRMHDNPALCSAAQQGRVVPVFVYPQGGIAPASALSYAGAAGQVWLHHSLTALQESLQGVLHLYRGNAAEILPEVCQRYQIAAVYYNRSFTPTGMEEEHGVEQALRQRRISTHPHNGNYLWEPQQVTKKDGSAYQVFTPFYRNALEHVEPPRYPLPVPEDLELLQVEDMSPGCEIKEEAQRKDITTPAQLNLLPRHPWADKVAHHWNMGEDAAHARLQRFVHSALPDYSHARNYPARDGVSHLSMALTWGEVSPHQLWHAVGCNPHVESGSDSQGFEFRRQLGWREFSCTQLYHNPYMQWRNLQPRFDRFPWRDDPVALQRWQRGETGYPIVDAGMRELRETGYMHNRVRMLVGSFLVKNMLLHWHHGEAWFRDCLVDADHANNCAGWQWIAGSGADAAPFFRIFNPVTQALKFDSRAEYVRRFVPQLRNLADTYIFEPWRAPAEVLRVAGVEMGRNYPHPVLDLKASRQRALDAYAQIKG